MMKIYNGRVPACGVFCSGGLLSSTLINVEGISTVFLEGIVSYSYESKLKRLDINVDRFSNSA